MTADLLDWTPPTGHRDGATYRPRFDYDRLNAQQKDVFDVVRDGGWRTLADIARLAGHPEASVSAQLRDFRKEKFGRLDVERRHVARGLYEYRVLS